ncbi:pentapeptide repeat-containing protein [Williamsia sp. DF01-3]|uniref:pentapeptide repeat-containing protein n=1 Tax=Williamsia sp. DF01-3 TaxID=2934157 RepID=UPI001FF5EC33|nr:pentapeptide repeat-containing protein [Williamsia sp. DF01-3]MCK0517530.1 pentapeptide repeat-containing protein [Williamsia sp. DF01-3]
MGDDEAVIARSLADGSGPRWWVRDVVVAGIVAVFVSVATMIGQKIIDDVRADRDHEISDRQSQRAERLENLRFIRGRSNADPSVERPFYGLDLAGLSLSGLDLPGANFSEADLHGCDLLSTNLQGANLSYAKLGDTILLGVDLRDANLVGAEFTDVTIDNEVAANPAPGQAGRLTSFDGAALQAVDFSGAVLWDVSFAGHDLSHAKFTGAELFGVDFTGANLTDVDFDEVKYDGATMWPEGFTPPPSTD